MASSTIERHEPHRLRHPVGHARRAGHRGSARHVSPPPSLGTAIPAATNARSHRSTLARDGVVRGRGRHRRHPKIGQASSPTGHAGADRPDEQEALRAQLLVGSLRLEAIARLAAVLGLFLLVVLVVVVLGGDEAVLEDAIEVGFDVVG